MMSSKGLVGCSAVTVLVVALAAAAEVYDTAAPGDPETDLAYQQDNDLDTGPIAEMNIPSLRDVMLYKMITALQAHHAQSRTPYGLNWFKIDEVPTTIIKDSVFKRLPGFTSIKNKDLPVAARPQPKWKTKKGKAMGSQLVCYFKLCAFRSPS